MASLAYCLTKVTLDEDDRARLDAGMSIDEVIELAQAEREELINMIEWESMSVEERRNSGASRRGSLRSWDRLNDEQRATFSQRAILSSETQENEQTNQIHDTQEQAATGGSIRSSAGQEYGSTLSGESPRTGFPEATRITDGSGRPLLVYRGAIQRLTTDDFNQLGAASGVSGAGLGIYFTPHRSFAQQHAEKNGGDHISDVYLDIRNPYYMRSEDLQMFGEAGFFSSLDSAAELRELLRADGFDGIVMEVTSHGGDPDIVAFEPGQIISQSSRVSFSRRQEVLSEISNIASFDTIMNEASEGDFKTNRDLKNFIQNKVLAAAKRANLNLTDVNDPDVFKYLVDTGVRDAVEALKSNANAVGWYDVTVRKALNILGTIHPELNTDPNARFAFTYALAATSNGIKVEKNFELAERAYQFYKKNGRMPTDIQAGNAQDAINKAMNNFNQLVEEIGIEDFAKFMTWTFEARQIEAALGRKVSGENATTEVLGSAIMGAKIGNGFFANLNGHFDQLTMDRWLTRTWGRWTGTLIENRPEMVKAKSEELAQLMNKLTPEELTTLKRLLGFGLPSPKVLTDRAARAEEGKLNANDRKYLARIGKRIQTISTSDKNRAALNATENGVALRLLGNNLAGWIDGQKEAPANGAERNDIRAVFGEILTNIRQRGYTNLTMSDLQALLWYPEKRLYDMAKSDEDVAAGYEDDEAPDYANAAAGLARAQGVSEAKIKKAIQDAQNGRTTGTGSGKPKAAQGQQAAVQTDAEREAESRRDRRDFLKRRILTRAIRSRGRDGSVRFYKGKSPGRTGEVGGVAQVFKPTVKAKNMMSRAEVPAPVLEELRPTSKNATLFRDAIQASKDASEYGAAVYVYPLERTIHDEGYVEDGYVDMRLFMTEDRTSGFAIKSDGDIVSVFSPGGGFSHSMLSLAVEEGGTKLDAFDTVLPHIYKINAFVEIRREPWNEELKPEGWDKEVFKDYNNGEPDIVYMEFNVAEATPAFSRRQAQTPEFKQWFGTGILTDKNGNPQVLYHGTPVEEVGQFKSMSHFGTSAAANDRILHKIAKDTNIGYSEETGEGNDFTVWDGDEMVDSDLTEQEARDLVLELRRQRAEEMDVTEPYNVVPVYLNIKNPLRIVDNGLEIPDKVADAVMDAGAIDNAERLSLDSVSNDAFEDALIELLESKGYDSLVYRNDVEGTPNEDSYAIFHPNQVKSAIGNNGEFNPEDNRIAFSRRQTQPVYYSAALQAAEKLKQSKGTVEQLTNMMTKSAKGVEEELDWLGVKEHFADRKTITRQELAEFIRANQVQVEEVVKDGTGLTDEWDEDAQAFVPSQTSPTKYEDYQLPGGENYRELLLTLPGRVVSPGAESKEVPLYEAKSRFDNGETLALVLFQRPWGEDSAYSVSSMEDVERIRNTYKDQADFVRLETWSKAPVYADEFTSGHYDEPNVLAHIRFNERTDADGARVLFIEEVQSDWHQEGRKKGYVGQDITAADVEIRRVPVDTLRAKWEYSSMIADYMEPYREKLGQDIDAPVVQYRLKGTPDTERWNTSFDANATAESLAQEIVKEPPTSNDFTQFGEERWKRINGVPNAPFKTTWPMLAMKRMIRYAADNGFDKIAWTSGEQQADRYDLSKQVSKVFLYDPAISSDKGWGDGWTLIAEDRDGGAVVQRTLSKKEDAEDYVGKDVAKKLIDQNTDVAVVEGEDLKVGGEGMKGFYDQILPSAMNKYLKKFKARVSGTTIPTKPKDYESDWRGFRVFNFETNETVATGLESVDAAHDWIKENLGTEGFDNHAVQESNLDRTTEEERALWQEDLAVHSVTITDEMRDMGSQPQAMFSRRQPNPAPIYATPESNIVKRWLKRNMTKEGLLPGEGFEAKITTDSFKQVGENENKFMIDALQAAVKKAYGKRYNLLGKTRLKEINDYLQGDKTGNLPPVVIQALVPMRGYLDNLSTQIAGAVDRQLQRITATMTPDNQALVQQAQAAYDSTGTIPEDINISDKAAALIRLKGTIRGNLGKYLTRSYQAFDDAGWKETALKDTALIEEAMDFIREQNPDLTEVEVAGAVRGILQSALDNGNFLSMISKGTKVGTKDVSILKKKNTEIPDVILRLLGEYKDPKLNFARSATKMQWYLANTYFLEQFHAAGMGSYLFDIPTGQYDARIAAKGNDAMNPLDGLYTTPEIIQGMEDIMDSFDGSDLMRTLIRMNSVVKYGKTILSPTTQFRNFMSASMFSIMNGHFNWLDSTKAFKATYADLMTSDAKWKGYLNGLIELGVIHNNPYASELRAAINDVTELDVYKKSPFQWAHKTADFMQRMYQFGDDFWKIIGFENEKRSLMNNGMTEAEAEKKAAYRIRNGYPTYSMVPRAVKKLRRWPLIGTFVSFPYEIIRTSYNQVGFIREDMKDNPAAAARRMLGLSIASAASYALSKMSMAMLGMDDDDDEAVRAQLPEWSRNSQLYYTGYDEDGMLRYVDLSYLDPYTYIKAPLTALMNGNNRGVDKKIIDALNQLAEPFIGTDIAAGAIHEIWSNKKSSGGPVYSSEDTAYRQTQDILNHARKAVQFGFMSNVERTVLALQGEHTESGKEYKIEDELKAWGGVRVGTLNLAESLIYKAYGFNDSKSNATKILSKVVGSRRTIDEGDIDDAFEAMMKSRERAYTKMIKLVEGSRQLGVTERDINRALRSARVSKTDIRALLKGDTPMWKMSPQFSKSALDRAIASTPGDADRNEIRQEIGKRKIYVRRLMNEWRKTHK